MDHLDNQEISCSFDGGGAANPPASSDVQPHPEHVLMPSQSIQFTQPQSTPQPFEFRLLGNNKGVQIGRRGCLGFRPNRYNLVQRVKVHQLHKFRKLELNAGLRYHTIAMSTVPNASITTVHRWERTRGKDLRHMEVLQRIRHYQIARRDRVGRLRRILARLRRIRLGEELPNPGDPEEDLIQRAFGLIHHLAEINQELTDLNEELVRHQNRRHH